MKNHVFILFRGCASSLSASEKPIYQVQECETLLHGKSVLMHSRNARAKPIAWTNHF